MNQQQIDQTPPKKIKNSRNAMAISSFLVSLIMFLFFCIGAIGHLIKNAFVIFSGITFIISIASFFVTFFMGIFSVNRTTVKYYKPLTICGIVLSTLNFVLPIIFVLVLYVKN